MSSQGLNATTYPASAQVVAPQQFPPRDASDVTRILKERVIYNAHKPTSVVGGNPLPYWIKGGNQFRLSYLFGKVECKACNSGNGGNPWPQPTLGS